MNKKTLFGLWAGFFIVCAVCGFIPSPEGALRVALTGLSLLFFLPPALLLYEAKQAKDTAAVLLVRNLSGLSLLLTLVLLVLNFLFSLGAETVGNFLHYLLITVSSPMVCSGYWVLSLFLWACLLTVSRNMLKEM